jgi:predicted nucleic acid-binding protein
MSRYCLDTSAYSQYRRGNEVVAGLIDSAEWIGLPAVVIGEILSGFLQDGLRERRERNEADLADFRSHSAVNELRIDHSVAKIYAEIWVALRSRGTPLPTNDIWVAACAARSGSTVLTFDTHFRAIERVGSLVLG